jgi:hypothetical protein
MRWGRLHVTMLQYSWDPLILPADDQAWANPGKGIVRVTVAALTLQILYPSIGCWVKLWF